MFGDAVRLEDDLVAAGLQVGRRRSRRAPSRAARSPTRRAVEVARAGPTAVAAAAVGRRRPGDPVDLGRRSRDRSAAGRRCWRTRAWTGVVEQNPAVSSPPAASTNAGDALARSSGVGLGRRVVPVVDVGRRGSRREARPVRVGRADPARPRGRRRSPARALSSSAGPSSGRRRVPPVERDPEQDVVHLRRRRSGG